MQENKRKILIVGAGRAGTALMKIFGGDPSVQIAGLVDIDPKAVGFTLAKKMNIPTAERWDEFLKGGRLDEIVNATGKEEVQQALLKQKPEDVEMAHGVMAKTVWFLAKEYETVERKIREAKEDVEALEWGVRKTNEAIKLLYKEIEEKNRELQDLDRLKSEFISTVSHELRTPLAITKEGITLIQDGILGAVNEKQAKVLMTSKESIDRLSRLINGLLDISKIEAGKIEIKKSLISMTALAKQVVSFFELKAKEKGLDLRLNAPAQDILAFADHDRIVQVLTNLVGNSLKFTDQGHIEISIKEHNDEIECGVADTGRGVAKEDIPKMFVKFQQINRVHGDGERGTGLGLSISKSIIEMHQGRIWVESEAGKGTLIIFTLPKYAEEVVLKEYVYNAVEEAKKNSHKMSVMTISIDETIKEKRLVSDDKIYFMLKGIEDVLKNSFHHSGSVALKHARECVVILPNSGCQAALSAEGRLKQAVDDFLAREQLADKIKLRFRCVTYPDEAPDAQGIIALVQKARSC